MKERQPKYPKEENLEEECEFWDMGCGFPKAEMMGRLSCDGIIDPVCIYLKSGKRVEGFNLSDEQVLELKLIPPDPNHLNHYIPASRPIKIF